MDGGRITKKYVLLICFTTVLLTVLYLSPQFILSSVTAVKTAAVKKTDIKAKVSCSGTIQTNQQQCIYYNMALKPKKIRIKIGDTVKTGQRLLDIDQEETVEAFSNRNLNDSVQQVQNTNGDDYSSYAGKLSSGQIDPAQYNSIISYYQNRSSQSMPSVSSSDEKNTEVPSYIDSPISGVVTAVNASDGDFTDPSKPVVIISNMDNLKIIAQVDEIYISKIRVGQSATIKGDGFQSVYNGRVSMIYPIARQVVNGTDTRTVVDVVISITNPDKNLKPGLSADADIVIADNKNSITVPYEAVQEDDSNKEFVFICKNGKAYKNYVSTGKEYNNRIEILSGLKEGDTVVISPPDNLKNGQAVKQQMIQAEVSGDD